MKECDTPEPQNTADQGTAVVKQMPDPRKQSAVPTRSRVPTLRLLPGREKQHGWERMDVR